jgi:hypothetical protein
MPDTPAEATTGDQAAASTGNAQVYVSHGDGWTHIGETDSPILIDHAHLHPAEPLAFQWPVSVTIKVDATDALAAITAAVGGIDSLKHLLDNPGGHGHCRTCHPEQDRRPLAVGGREHRQRKMNRRRRR